MENLPDIISTLGFPMAAYVALFWYMMRKDADHKEEVTQMTEAIKNNTLALQHLADVAAYEGKH